MAGKSLADFFAVLGFKVDDTGLKKFNQELKNVAKDVAVVYAAISAAAVAVGGFMYKMTKGLDDLNDFANLNNVNVEQLQRLQYAAEQMDSSAEAVKNSIGGLNSVIGQAATGVGRGALIMQKFGLSAKDANGRVKDTATVLEEVRQKMLGMSAAERISMAERMGLDRTLVPMLTDTTGKFEKLIVEANDFIIAADDVKAASDLMDSGFKRLKLQVMGLFYSVAVKFIPVMDKFVKQIIDFFNKNKEAITQGLLKAMELFIGAFYSLVNATGALWNAGKGIIEMFGGWRNALEILLPIVAILAAVFFPIHTAIIGVILLLDDFITWTKGGESAFGGFYEKIMPWLKFMQAQFNLTIQIVRLLWEVIKATFIGLDKFVSLITGSGVLTWLKQAWELAEKVSKFAGKWIGKGADWLRESNLEATQTTVNAAGGSVVQNDNRKVAITVSSPDPDKAGKAVIRELNRDKKAIIRNAQGGFAY